MACLYETNVSQDVIWSILLHRKWHHKLRHITYGDFNYPNNTVASRFFIQAVRRHRVIASITIFLTRHCTFSETADNITPQPHFDHTASASQDHRMEVVRWPCDSHDVTYVSTLSCMPGKSYGDLRLTAGTERYLVNRTSNLRRPSGDRTMCVRLPCSNIMAAVRFLDTKKRIHTVGHLTVIARPPQDRHAVHDLAILRAFDGGLTTLVRWPHGRLVGHLTEFDLMNLTIAMRSP